MQRLEVSGAVRLIHGSLGVKRLIWPLHWNVRRLWVYPKDGDSIETLLSTCIAESHLWRVALLLRVWEMLGSASRKETGCPDCRLSEFAKLPKLLLPPSCLSACLSVRPSVRIEWLSSHWTNFHETWYLSIFAKKKSVDKIQVSWKSDSNNRCFTCSPIYIYDHISLRSSRMKNDSEKIRRENRKPKLTFYIKYNFAEDRAVCEKMSKNIVEPGRPQVKIQCLRIACWVPKGVRARAHTHL